eukprot:3063709-Alexandrium_andersonii.AAC.1
MPTVGTLLRLRRAPLARGGRRAAHDTVQPRLGAMAVLQWSGQEVTVRATASCRGLSIPSRRS